MSSSGRGCHGLKGGWRRGPARRLTVRLEETLLCTGQSKVSTDRHKVPHAGAREGYWCHQAVSTHFLVRPSLLSQMCSLNPLAGRSHTQEPGQLLPSEGPSEQCKSLSLQVLWAPSFLQRLPWYLVKSLFTSYSYHGTERSIQYFLYMEYLDGHKAGNKLFCS